MFARTNRLTLRPAWQEDAAELAAAIDHEAVTRMLSRVPYPYTLSDAEAFCARPHAPDDARMLIVSHDLAWPDGAPAIVGGIGISEIDGEPNLGYWLTPAAWGRGYATEAGQAVIAMARHALGLRRIAGWHFADNPASGAVLRKLGFRPTGQTGVKHSLGRTEPAPSIAYSLDLDAAQEDHPALRIAA